MFIYLIFHPLRDLSFAQKIFILTGTFRMNLDPHGRHSDEELWSVAEQVPYYSLTFPIIGKLVVFKMKRWAICDQGPTTVNEVFAFLRLSKAANLK